MAITRVQITQQSPAIIASQDMILPQISVIFEWDRFLSEHYIRYFTDVGMSLQNCSPDVLLLRKI